MTPPLDCITSNDPANPSSMETFLELLQVPGELGARVRVDHRRAQALELADLREHVTRQAHETVGVILGDDLGHPALVGVGS